MVDTAIAFIRGMETAKDPVRVFDWVRAAKIIAERKPRVASAGLSGDWEWTGGDIYRDGSPVPADETYTYLASTWATPELDVDGELIDCWCWANESGWDSGTYWPDEALAALAGRSITSMDNIITAETVYSDCYWTDDSRNAFREAVHAEGLRQVMASDESQAELLSEKIFAQHVKLLRSNPAEFAKRCAEMIEEAADDFAETTIVARVMDFCDTPKAEGMSVREMVEHVLSDQFSPWAEGKGP